MYRSPSETHFEMNLIVWSQIMWQYWYLLSHMVSVDMVIVSAIKHKLFISYMKGIAIIFLMYQSLMTKVLLLF